MQEELAVPTRSSRRYRSAPTIRDVAQRAGVSLMTVSRVINAETNVRPVTRARVEAAISLLKFIPNQAARGLAGAAQVRIGLLYANNASFIGEFLHGSFDEATRSNVQFVLESCDPDSCGAQAVARLIGNGVEAVVLTPPLSESQPVLAAFAAAGIPTALFATTGTTLGALAVAIDDRRAASEMTRHLIALGHRRIGFIAGDPNLSASVKRLQGYNDQLKEAGLNCKPALIAIGLSTYRSGLNASERLLDLAEPPTAIFASNDDMAAAAVAVANRRGLDVPSDLTVVGFEDTFMAKAIWPELTTIRQPIADMARQAIRLLADAISGLRVCDTALAPSLFNFALIRRQSDASPRPR